MKVAVIGCGSMGNKHIKNLIDLGQDVVICDKSSTRLQQVAQKFGVKKTYVDYEELSRHEAVEAVVIATDTALHAKIATAFAKKGIAYFSEIPISDSIKDTHELATVTIENKVVSMVGMVWRFHPAIQKIRKLIQENAIGRVLTMSLYGGEYLPDWHPKEPYKTEYSALRQKGGGVIITNISGLDYLRYFCGEVENAFCVYDSVSPIQIEAEDFCMGVFQFQNGAFAQVYSDFFQRPVENRLDIVGEKGKIQWDDREKKVRLYPLSAGPNGDWEVYPYELDNFLTLYVEEMKHFLQCVQEKKETLIPLQDNLKSLLVAEAMKRSFVERRMVNLRSLNWAL